MHRTNAADEPAVSGKESGTVTDSVKEAADRLRVAWIAAALFAVLTLPRLLAHELWRDEAWLWLVVSESASFSELGASLARSGQGYLFPLLCYFAHGISASPLVMQLLHLVIAVAGVFVFVRWAPFSIAQRGLVVVGYLTFYEYAVISRHYALGMLLLWLGCAASRARRPAVAMGAALGLLCQTTVYGILLAIAVAAGWLFERRFRPRDGSSGPALNVPLQAPPKLPFGEAAAGLGLAIAGGIAGLMQISPLPGTSFAESWRFGWHPDVALQAMQIPWRAFVPLPRPGLHFWNSNLLDSWPVLQALAGLLVLAGAVALVWPRKAAVVTLLVGAAGFSAFGYTKYIGLMRHHGHWWLLLLAAIWVGGGLATTTSAATSATSATARAARAERASWRTAAFVVVLLIHAVAGAYASWVDLRHPFSNGPRTAVVLRELSLDRLPLLGYREPPAAAVALALGQPLFSPSRGIYTTHPDWGPQQRELALPELRCAARALAGREGRDVVLVMNSELPPWTEIVAAGAVLGAIQESEDYRLYRLLHARLAASAAAARCPAPSN